MFAPSLFAHILNGFFLLVSIVILYLNWKSIWQLDSYRLLILTMIASITAGVHGLSHLGLEAVYGYNPLYFFYT